MHGMSRWVTDNKGTEFAARHIGQVLKIDESLHPAQTSTVSPLAGPFLEVACVDERDQCTPLPSQHPRHSRVQRNCNYHISVGGGIALFESAVRIALGPYRQSLPPSNNVASGGSKHAQAQGPPNWARQRTRRFR